LNKFDGTAMSETSAEITHWLKEWRRGEVSALDRLTPLVYDELRRMARVYMRKESPGHMLQATALVNEAFLRLVDSRDVDWHDRAHFFAVSARIMRRILVDAARARGALKCGGGLERIVHSTAVNLEHLPAVASELPEQLCALDDALEELARMDPRRAQVVDLRFFGGLTVEETGQVLDISPQTVMRDWKLARAWLARELAR
jgi:RNA polymerase sigma factor (TIGR02999 family)